MQETTNLDAQEHAALRNAEIQQEAAREEQDRLDLEQARAAAAALEQQNAEALRLVREALHYLSPTAHYPAARVTLQQAETLLAGDDA